MVRRAMIRRLEKAIRRDLDVADRCQIDAFLAGVLVDTHLDSGVVDGELYAALRDEAAWKTTHENFAAYLQARARRRRSLIRVLGG